MISDPNSICSVHFSLLCYLIYSRVLGMGAWAGGGTLVPAILYFASWTTCSPRAGIGHACLSETPLHVLGSQRPLPSTSSFYFGPLPSPEYSQKHMQRIVLEKSFRRCMTKHAIIIQLNMQLSWNLAFDSRALTQRNE